MTGPQNFEHTRTCDDLMVGRYIRRLAETDGDYLVGTAAYATEQGLFWRGKCSCATDRLKTLREELARKRAAQRHTWDYQRSQEIETLIQQRDRLAREIGATK